MKKLKSPLLWMLFALVVFIAPVLAMDTIRVDPHESHFGLPIMLTSPARFSVDIIDGAGNRTTNPHTFLVMK